MAESSSLMRRHHATDGEVFRGAHKKGYFRFTGQPLEYINSSEWPDTFFFAIKKQQICIYFCSDDTINGTIIPTWLIKGGGSMKVDLQSDVNEKSGPIFKYADSTEQSSVGWDSAGNDHAHDGDGIGHEAGDHTGYGRLGITRRSMRQDQKLSIAEGLALPELLEVRTRLLVET